MKEFICICCPQGCHLKVDEDNGYEVSGNSCERGAEYGRSEATAPVRVVTSVVRVEGQGAARCPVKTDRAVPKEMIFNVVEAVKSISARAPLRIGDILISNVCGTGANVVVTKNIG